MHVILVQPPDAPAPIPESAGPWTQARSLVPPWDLLCLRTYLHRHSRHLCKVVDARLFGRVEQDLVAAIQSVPAPRLLVVHAAPAGIGEATGIVVMAKSYFPDLRAAMIGPFPSQFPGQVAAMPQVDFGLAGDPEPILRQLLDNIDLPPRLAHIAGLVTRATVAPESAWLPQLNSLVLPEWEDFFWPPYQAATPGHARRVSARLSRGHTHRPADRAAGRCREPLRLWPDDKLAAAFDSLSHRNIAEILLADPPGLWTDQRLRSWCAALRRRMNIQPWAFRLLPQDIPADLAADLAASVCRRVEFLVPAWTAEDLAGYDCTLDPPRFKRTLETLKACAIQPDLVFWIGGPGARSHDHLAMSRLVRGLGHYHFVMAPFPFEIDSPLYEEISRTAALPHLDDWLRWSRAPWVLERPVPLWHGAAGVGQYQETIRRLQRALALHPGRLIAAGRGLCRAAARWYAGSPRPSAFAAPPPYPGT